MALVGTHPGCRVLADIGREEMNYLVTGGAGYLGSVLVPELLRAGHRVTVLDRFVAPTALAEACQYEGFRPVRGEVRDLALVAKLAAKVDVVIPLAALVGAP